MSRRTHLRLFYFLAFSIVMLIGIRYVDAAASNRAAIIVQFDDGTTETRCVNFDEQSITGYELLERSGLSIIASYESQGAAICKIEAVGCPANDCFCQSPPDYWSYWQLENDQWAYSPQGSSSTQLQDGDVDGWRWGTGDPPDVIPFDQICTTENEISTATPTLSPTTTQTPTTSTVVVTNTAAPTYQPYPAPSRGVATATEIIIPTESPGAALESANLTPESNTTPAQVPATPINPHILLPAKLILPTTRPATSPPTMPAPELETAPDPAYATQETQEAANASADSTGNYIVFGVLAGALLLVAGFQANKIRKL